MKNRYFVYMFTVQVLLFGLVQTANAQLGEMRFKNGIKVVIKTDQNKEQDQNFTNIYTSPATDENVVYRLLIDKKNKLYFGYELEIVPTADTEKFEVFIKPLSFKGENGNVLKEITEEYNSSLGSLPKYPDKILVQEGDTIAFDILENSQTKQKISDSIKITRKKQKLENYFTQPKNPGDFTVNDVKLSVLGFDIYVNDEKVKFAGGGMIGSVIWIYFPNKGRFIFSPIEQPGYNFQRLGVIDDKTMDFNYAGVNYKFISNTPILSSFGKWNLWVMFDPDYQPNSQTSDDKSFQLGAAGKVESLFKNQR